MNTFGPQPEARVSWWALLIATLLILLSIASGLAAAVAGFVAPDELSAPVLLIVGLLLIVGGPVAGGIIMDSELKLARTRNLHPRCPQCDYDLRYLPEPRCPECGKRWEVRAAHRPARHDRR